MIRSSITIDKKYINDVGIQRLKQHFQSYTNNVDIVIMRTYDDGVYSVDDTFYTKRVRREIVNDTIPYTYRDEIIYPAHSSSKYERVIHHNTIHKYYSCRVGSCIFDMEIVNTISCHTRNLSYNTSIVIYSTYDNASYLVSEILKIHHNIPSITNIVDRYAYVKNMLEDVGIYTSQDIQRVVNIQWNQMNESTICSYSVSFKADGLRRLLLYTSHGTYYISNTLDIIILDDEVSTDTILMDGELVDDIYWVFDLIYYKNKSYISIDQISRLNTLISIVFEKELLLKPILFMSNKYELYTNIAILQDFICKSNIKTDGFIFTPMHEGYNCTSYKWKPLDSLTLDFYIGKRYELGLIKDKCLFFHPLYRIKNKDDVPKGYICEMKYLGDNLWEYVRTRDDKHLPNGYRVLDININLMENPIPLEILTGDRDYMFNNYAKDSYIVYVDTDNTYNPDTMYRPHFIVHSDNVVQEIESLGYKVLFCRDIPDNTLINCNNLSHYKIVTIE